MAIEELQTDLKDKHNSISYLLSDIQQPKYQELFKRLSKNDNSCLDIGFRVPVNLFMLYHIHILNFKRFVGLDNRSEEECIKDFIRQHSEETEKSSFSNCKTLHDVYLKCVIPDVESGEPPLIDKEEDFAATFPELLYNTDMFDYVSNNQKQEKIGFVIISNILHFFGNRANSDLIGGIKKMMTKDGVIFIRVQNKPLAHFDYEGFKEVIKSHFSEGTLIEYFKDGKWNCSTFINVKIGS